MIGLKMLFLTILFVGAIVYRKKFFDKFISIIRSEPLQSCSMDKMFKKYLDFKITREIAKSGAKWQNYNKQEQSNNSEVLTKKEEGPPPKRESKESVSEKSTTNKQNDSSSQEKQQNEGSTEETVAKTNSTNDVPTREKQQKPGSSRKAQPKARTNNTPTDKPGRNTPDSKSTVKESSGGRDLRDIDPDEEAIWSSLMNDVDTVDYEGQDVSERISNKGRGSVNVSQPDYGEPHNGQAIRPGSLLSRMEKVYHELQENKPLKKDHIPHDNVENIEKGVNVSQSDENTVHKKMPINQHSNDYTSDAGEGYKGYESQAKNREKKREPLVKTIPKPREQVNLPDKGGSQERLPVNHPGEKTQRSPEGARQPQQQKVRLKLRRHLSSVEQETADGGVGREIQYQLSQVKETSPLKRHQPEANKNRPQNTLLKSETEQGSQEKQRESEEMSLH